MDKRIERIVEWIEGYAENAGKETLVVGVSGGVDSALTSTLCCMTGLEVYAVTMPLRSGRNDHMKAVQHLSWLSDRFPERVHSVVIPLERSFNEFGKVLQMEDFGPYAHASANTKSRLRMTCLYHIAACMDGLVVGTGNKVEDFGVGFFTKWGDGGVDISPIGDLFKSEVQYLAMVLGIYEESVLQPPTDGLWEDGRTDEDQLQMSYEDLEKCMRGEYVGEEKMARYEALRKANRHKMEPIPVCMMEDWDF
mgnify:CR=1 FL=1